MFIERVIHIDTIVSGLLRRFAPRNDGHCERSEAIQFFGLPLIIALVFFVNAAHPSTVPYITDVVGEDGEVLHVDEGGEAGESAPRLLGVFKLFNPDTVPFYLWVSFENGGKLTHYHSGQSVQTVRLVDMELRYKNARQQPVVKKFSDNRSDRREKKRFGGSWLGGGRPGKSGRSGKSVGEGAEAEIEAAAERGGGRGRGTSEIVFWKEDAQGYYEMELWGVLYAPDMKGVAVKGRYAENIRFEIEPMK